MGGTLVVHEVYQRDDGSLGVNPPEGIAGAFSKQTQLTDSATTLSTQDSSTDALLAEHTGDHFIVHIDLEFKAGTRAFGIRLFEDKETGDAYVFDCDMGESRLIFDRSPNLPWYRCMNKGLERPLRLEAGRRYNIQVIVDDTIATLYLDGVALNTRMYSKAGDSLGVYVIDGELTIHNAVLHTELTATPA